MDNHLGYDMPEKKTMKFNWEGFTALGQQKTGSLEAESEGEAAGKLREMGIMAQNIQPDGPEPFKTVFPNSTEWKQPESSYPVKDMRNQDQHERRAHEEKVIEGRLDAWGSLPPGGFSGVHGPSVQMECMNCHGTGKMGGEVCSQCNGKPHRSKQGSTWQENLRMNLADVKIVMEYARELDGNMRGIYEAEVEMNKQAIMKALKDLRA